MVTGIAIISVTVTILMSFAILTWLITSALDGFDEDFHTNRMARWNFFKWIICISRKLWNAFISTKPRTGIDKEIAEEEKEIAELEKHKEKMDTLAELKRRKDRLFKDVHSE